MNNTVIDSVVDTAALEEAMMGMIAIGDGNLFEMSSFRTALAVTRPADDHSDDPANATLVQTDGTVTTGELDTLTDDDFFTFTASAGEEIAVTTNTDFAGAVETYSVRVFDPNGDLVERIVPLSFGEETLRFIADIDGDYLIEIDGFVTVAPAAAGALGNYELAVSASLAGQPILGDGDDNRLDGTVGDDIIRGLAGDDRIIGEAGNDRLAGGAGDDVLLGGEGDDRLFGGRDEDFLEGEQGDDLLTGNEGDDTLFGGSGDDRLSGDEGNDILRGGAGNDSLNGGNGDDRLFGGVSDDELSGGNGDDRLFGGDGDDELSGGNGDDRLFGGDGDDELSGGANADVLSGDDGADKLSGGGGDDRLLGGEGEDLLLGDGGNDFLAGSLGDDLLEGGAGNDNLNGDSGNDYLAGGAGDDLLFGGGGNDVLIGDEGADTFRFGVRANGNDVINDFEDGVDIIELLMVPELDFDELTIIQERDDTVIFVTDPDAIGVSQFSIRLVDTDVSTIDENDFSIPQASSASSARAAIVQAEAALELDPIIDDSFMMDMIG